MKHSRVPTTPTVLGTLTKKSRKRYEPRRSKRRVARLRRRKAVSKPSARFEDTNSEYLSVSRLTSLRPITKGTVYEWIQTEPSFPWQNIGLKKKLVVSLPKFDEWIIWRSEVMKTVLTGVPMVSKLKSKLRKAKR